MKKLYAIQSYLVSQFKYDIQLGWLINGIVCMVFMVLPFIIDPTVTFGLTPSAAIYVIVAVHGLNWTRRTLSYLLRLGANRQAYSVGTVIFSLLFNIVNALIITLICGIYKFIESFSSSYKLLFMHPVQLVSSDLSLFSIFVFDFLLCNIIFLLFILFSIAYHRIGKLGANLVLTVIAILLIVNVTFNGISSLFSWLIKFDTMISLGVALLVIAVLSLIIFISTRSTSINKCNI